ncbi:26S proteasome non-ATPase regulatory subunit 5 [Clonorchis sinensis]|uniref:26S proteasome non-ATPase regulatory subunit 5 n=1 Tax=Clonorchis sinensis TaxID=79923 RepID=G7YVQ5_CLOSI|nr:26S proteasome non-ATPase regulatory subunit 5 [Clonorchis sinensis]
MRTMSVNETNSVKPSSSSTDVAASSITESNFDDEARRTFESWFEKYKDMFQSDFSQFDGAWKFRLLLRELGKAEHGRFTNFVLPKLPRDLGFADTVKTPARIFGYLAFFGCVARQHPVVWIPVDKCSALVSVLSNAIESSDQRISLAAMESVGHIAASADGRKLLRTHLAPTGRLKLLLVKLGRFVQNSETFILLRSVDCVADFLTRPAVLFNTLEAEEQAQISLEWAALIGQPEDSNHAGIESRRSAKILLKRLITLATNPFPDMRLAALRTIRSMATQPWGVRLFLDQPGCMEYLLNRKTEVGLPEVSQLMQTKYDIVKNILTTMDFYKTCEVPEFHVHLRPEQLACLKLYIKEGVWGAQQAQATIAMQSG